MKKYGNAFGVLSTLILLVSCISFSSCSKDENENARDKTRTLLSGTWHSTNVTADGVNKNDSFTGFALTFSSSTFSAVHGDPVWSTSGTWTFTDNNAKIFKRDDDVEVTITTITETNLTLALHWNKTTLGGGRVNSINGNFVFEFNK